MVISTMMEDDANSDGEDAAWEISEKAVGYVTAALNGGWLRGLEELNLSGDGCMSQEGLQSILAALKHGACPLLRRLDLTRLHSEMWGLAEALESGNLHNLQELLLYYNFLGGSGRGHRRWQCSPPAQPTTESGQRWRRDGDTIGGGGGCAGRLGRSGAGGLSVW